MSLSPELAALVKGQKNKYSRSGGRALKLKEGKTRVRVLPAREGVKFWADLGVHWIKTESGQNAKPVAVVGCHDHVHEKPCPICTAIEKAIKSAVDDESLAIMKEWKAKKSVVVNALIRSGSDASDEPQILELTTTTFGTILSMMEEYGNVVDLNEGMDFNIERKGKGLNTEYTVMPVLKSEPVKKSVMDKITNLDEWIEKEFFKGEESKALGHIANMSGISVAGIIAGAAKAGVLTGPSAKAAEEVVIEASVEKVKPAVKSPAAEKPAESFGVPLEESEVADILAELDTL